MRLTIVTIVGNEKGPALDKFFWAVNRYGRSHKVLVVMCPYHRVKDPEKLRKKYKSLDIQYHYTQMEAFTIDDLPVMLSGEVDFNRAIYLDLEKPDL